MRPLRLEFNLSYLASLVSSRTERRTVVGEDSSPRPDQHSGSQNNWRHYAAFAMTSEKDWTF